MQYKRRFICFQKDHVFFTTEVCMEYYVEDLYRNVKK